MAKNDFKSYVPPETNLKEFTLKAVILGLFMTVILGAANAYLGLKAGMTIAATYPAAVIGMAVLRLMRGNILEENIARTVGSIGESVAAGAIFTIPAFIIAEVAGRKVWEGDFWSVSHYLQATAIMFVGAVIGILFVTILRRVMVEDTELPFPESVAAAEIHKAGQSSGSGAKFLFGAMGLGALTQFLKEFKVFASKGEAFISFGKKTLGIGSASAQTGGGALISTPGVSPAYMGVGYIIGPQLAALNFTGGLLAWGLFVPLLLYFLGPQLLGSEIASEDGINMAVSVWRNIVRPIAIGGMLMSAAYTLFRMRKSLSAGLGRAVKDVRAAASGTSKQEVRTQKDMNFKWVFIGIGLASIATFFIYYYFAGTDGRRSGRHNRYDHCRFLFCSCFRLSGRFDRFKQ